MAGHKAAPKASDYGRNIDGYLRALEAWKATPKNTQPKPPVGGEGGVRNNPITGALEVWVPGVGWVTADPGGGDTGGDTGGAAARTLAEDMRLLEEKYKWDSKLELEVLTLEWEKRGKHDVKLENLSHENRLKYLRTEITLTKDMKLELMIKQHGFDKIMQDDQQAFERLQQADQNEWQESQNDLDRLEQQKDRDLEEKQREEDRKLQRFVEVQQLRGRDPVRAALMAMGAGDPNDPLGGKFEDLGAMEGSEELQRTTESALQGIEGLGGEGLSLGEQGVSGLQNVEKAGRAFTQGSDATQTLIRSAQGVGSGTQAGVNEQDVQDRVAAITPKGFDFKAAAEGAGLSPLEAANAPTAVGSGTAGGQEPVQSNTVYQTGEAGREALVVGEDQRLKSIVPLENQARVGADAYAAGVREPTLQTQGPESLGYDRDPLVNMFNDPSFTLNKSGPVRYDPRSELPPMTRPQPTPGDMIMIIKRKRASGIPLTPEEEELVARVHPRVFEMENPQFDSNLGLSTLEGRKNDYFANLPPAQRAALAQKAKQTQQQQQDRLVNSFDPQTIQKLYDLINNPNRGVNKNLQERLPQLRDGAGNITSRPQGRPLATVV